jgi:hypothetical protein
VVVDSVADAAAAAVVDAAVVEADAVDKNNFYMMRSTNMKRSGTTTTFVLVCVAVLLASYGIGFGIKMYRFRNVENQTTASQTPAPTQVLPQRQATPVAGSPETGQPDATIFRGGRNSDGTQDERAAQMRTFGSGRRGRRGMDMQNLSEEERAAMEEQRQQMMERFQNMTDEERAQFRGGRGGRGGRNRGDMSNFGAGANDSGAGQADFGSGEDNTGSGGENDTGSDVNDNQSGDNGFNPGDNG